MRFILAEAAQFLNQVMGLTLSADDIAALEEFAKEHQPRIYFTQSVMQNPTGTDMSPHVAFRVLQLAEKFDFVVVEDDIFCDLQTRKTPRLAALDRQMAAQYRSAAVAAGPRQQAVLRATRDAFLRYRDGCGSDACVAGAYSRRFRRAK